MGLFCIIQLTILLNEDKSKDEALELGPSSSRSDRRHRRNKELLPLAQTSKLPDSQKY